MRAAANRQIINSEIIACIERCVRRRKIDPEEILVDARCIRELTSHDQITDDESLDKGHRWVTIIVEMFLCWIANRSNRRDLSGGCGMDCIAAVKERISEFLAKYLRNGLITPDQANLIMEQAGVLMTGRKTDCGGSNHYGKRR